MGNQPLNLNTPKITLGLQKKKILSITDLILLFNFNDLKQLYSYLGKFCKLSQFDT